MTRKRREWRMRAETATAPNLLVGFIVHDFNNLITAIVGAADAVADRPGLDPPTREDVATIRAAADRAAALARRLLPAGAQTEKPRVLVVNDQVAGLASVLRHLLGMRVRLVLALDTPGRLVRADATALDRVLLNLAINARNAMLEGGTLTLRTGFVELTEKLPTVPPGRYATIEVRDTGIGIPPELVSRIFDPLFTTRRAVGGSGLGLASVHQIVRQSGGFLAVESVPGEGTTMRIYLPDWQGAVPDAPAAPAAVAARQRGALLLVEDEDSVRRITARGLARQGWQVLEAATAEAALDVLAATRPPALRAVVSDLMMPGLDGTWLVRAVREHLADPTLPAILVSGYTAHEVRDRIARDLAGGATEFLAKPYDMTELAAKLEAVVTAGGA